MNFIAHYYLDHTNPESFFALGAATPDLLSIFNPALRIKKHHLADPALFSKGNHHHLHSGIHRHFEADALFHSSEFFSRETHHLFQQMQEKFPENALPRKFFLAHILVELILDRVIMRDHPGIIVDYYHHFDRTPMRELREATEDISGHKLPNYDHFLNKFKENRYLLHYLEWDHIGFVVGRILRRVGIENTQFVSRDGFYDLLEDYERRLMPLYPSLFQEMQSRSRKAG